MTFVLALAVALVIVRYWKQVAIFLGVVVLAVVFVGITDILTTVTASTSL